MNKKLVDSLIPLAYDELAHVGIAVDGKVPKAFRGQISSFGAAVSSGSLLAASAFFSDQAGAQVERQKLMQAINDMLGAQPLNVATGVSLFDTIRNWKQVHGGSDREIKEKVLSCAVALKLAMNLYQLTPEKSATSHEQGEEAAS